MIELCNRLAREVFSEIEKVKPEMSAQRNVIETSNIGNEKEICKVVPFVKTVF